MNILPAVKSASASKNVGDKLAFGAKNAPGASRNAPGFFDTKHAPAFSDIKKAPAFAELKAAPAFSDLKNIPAFSDAKQASSSAKQAPALADAKIAPVVSGAKNVPDFVGAKKAPAFSDMLRQAQEEIRANSGHSRNIRHDIRQDVRRDVREHMPSLHDIRQDARQDLRRAVSRDVRESMPSLQDVRQDVRQDIRERVPFLTRIQQGDGRQAESGARDVPHPHALGAHLSAAAPAAAGKGDFQRNARQQHSPAEARQQNFQQDVAPEARQDHPLLEAPQEPGPDRQRYTPLEKAPATPHSANGVHYQLGEVGFTQRELARLRDKLLQEGLSPQSLTVIEQLASHPHGATLGQLLALMHGSLLQQTPLSERDAISLQHFTDKIDISGALGKDVARLLEDGRPKDAWDVLKSALVNLDPRERIVFEQGEAALLCKAFGASRQASLEVLTHFGNSEGLLLTSDIFTAVMLPAQQEILDTTRQNNRLGTALAKHLQPLIDEARLRAEKERQAAEGTDRRSKQSEALIRDKFMAGFRKDVAAPEKDEANPPAKNAEAFGNRAEEPGRKDEAGRNNRADRQAEAQLRQGQPGKAEESKTPWSREDAPLAPDSNKAVNTAAGAEKTPDAAPAPQKPVSGQDMPARAEADEGHRHAQRPREDRQGGNSESNQDARRDSRWEGLLSRLETRPGAQADTLHTASGFIMGAQPQEQSAGHISSPAPLIRHALQQVEQGSLSRLANGGQRLELQLAPSELGAVTLILTSAKSGEISAVIRSERSETAELVSRHLDMIRVSLEEQGLKVDKLEVRNEMPGRQDDWQGAEQHNAMREEQERREQLEHLRRLGRHGEDAAPRAQDMQSSGHAAEISGQGLHLVA